MFTKTTIAKAIGISSSSLSYIISGKREIPYPTAVKLAILYGGTINYLRKANYLDIETAYIKKLREEFNNADGNGGR